MTDTNSILNPSLMSRLLEAGYPREEMDSHESDLYVYVTPLTTKVINEWCRENGFERKWHCPIFFFFFTGKLMYDFLFCFDDYWRERGF